MMDNNEKKIRRRQFLSFAIFIGSGASAYGLWSRFKGLPTNDNALSHTTRQVLDMNENANNALFSNSHLAPSYPISKAAPKPRVNGDVGVSDDDFDTSNWKLRVKVPESTENVLEISLDELKQLPKTEVCFDFKCIEGWNEIVHYGGVRFSDFLNHYHLGTKSSQNAQNHQSSDWYNYISLETPDGEYYVGLDMKSALHPQTILCYELNREPLPLAHGAPLRLIIPVKYGVKNLKRIGTMSFSDVRPKDYWYERGYVYDAAL